MKRIIPLAIVAIMLIPNLAFASWWNPLTWFKQRDDVKIFNNTETLDTPKDVIETTPTSIPKTTPFYIKYNNTRIRSCASMGCDIIDYFNSGTIITVPTEGKVLSLDDLPEWQLVMTLDQQHEGYIHKSTLSKEPVEIIQPKVTSPAVNQFPIENTGRLNKNKPVDHSINESPSKVIDQTTIIKDVSQYKNELHQFTKSLHGKISSTKEIIGIEITFANNVSNTIKSEQTPKSTSVTYFVEKTIPSRINYYDATVNLLDSIDRHVTKIENLVDSAKYTTVLDIYYKSLITDEEDTARIDKEIKASSDKFNDIVSGINKDLGQTKVPINLPSSSQTSTYDTSMTNQTTSIDAPILVTGRQYSAKLRNFIFTGRTANDTTGIRSSCILPNGVTISFANWMVGNDEIRSEIGDYYASQYGNGSNAGTYKCYFSIDGTNIKSPEITIEWL